MSIYSANRIGSMNMSQVVANEAYSDNDLGRIMYESQMNDMAIFEAVLACDFREIQSLREGTLLESEIQAMNEASFKDLLNTLQDRLKKFWAKIKAAFKAAMDKIAAYCLNDGKAFARNFRNVQAKYKGKWTGSIDNVKLYDCTGVEIPSVDDVNRKILDKKNDSDLSKDAIVAEELGRMVGEKVATSDYVAKVLEKSCNTTTVDHTDIDGLLAIVESGAKTIRDLKDAEKRAGTAIDKLAKSLKDAEKQLAATNKASGGVEPVASVKNITTLVSAYETIISLTTKAAISCEKANVKSARSALGQVLSDLRKNNEKLKESAAIDAADEVDIALSDAPAAVDSEAQEAIDDLVASAEE